MRNADGKKVSSSSLLLTCDLRQIISPLSIPFYNLWIFEVSFSLGLSVYFWFSSLITWVIGYSFYELKFLATCLFSLKCSKVNENRKKSLKGNISVNMLERRALN